MNRKLPTALCVLIALLLVVFGLLYGTWSGYREDRAQVEELLTMENGLMDVLGYRAADGLNLCVVAKRHLPFEEVQELEQFAHQLMQTEEIGALPALDRAVSEAFAATSRKLLETVSFQQSERDQRYLDMLTADLNSLHSSEIVSAYNRAAAKYNAQLEQPLIGTLAMWLGIEKCPLYE